MALFFGHSEDTRCRSKSFAKNRKIWLLSQQSDMRGPFVAYPRHRDLPVASMGELLDMSDARVMAIKALVLSPIVGAGLTLVLRPPAGSEDFFIGMSLIVLCALGWLACHAIATFQCA
jgi:hypothetical protein